MAGSKFVDLWRHSKLSILHRHAVTPVVIVDADDGNCLATPPSSVDQHCALLHRRSHSKSITLDEMALGD